MSPKMPNFYMRKYNRPFAFGLKKKSFAYIDGKLTEVDARGRPLAKAEDKPEQAKKD